MGRGKENPREVYRCLLLQEQDMTGWVSAVIERRTLLGWTIVAIVGAIAVATLLALVRPSFASHGETDYEDVPAELEQLREATDKYHSVTKALKDGYVAPTHKDPPHSLNCVYNRALQAGMGYHFVHRQDVLEGSPFEIGVGGDPLKPEAMLYEAKNGKLSLIAVEWIVRYDRVTGQPDTQPLLELGDNNAEPFHGPMAGHEYWAESTYLEGPNGEAWMPWHYDLHAWIWKNNSRGLFDDWNPDVSCP
jgi:hypothetical protein